MRTARDRRGADHGEPPQAVKVVTVPRDTIDHIKHPVAEAPALGDDDVVGAAVGDDDLGDDAVRS